MSRVSTQQAFDLAMQHHRAGRYSEAEQLYRQILVESRSTCMRCIIWV